MVGGEQIRIGLILPLLLGKQFTPQYLQPCSPLSVVLLDLQELTFSRGTTDGRLECTLFKLLLFTLLITRRSGDPG